MANFNKFKVTWEGSGGIFLGGANRVQGEIFTLPADQVDKLLKTSDFENGYLIPLDEDVSAFSSDILRQLDGKSRAFSKSNYVPPVVMNLVTTTSAGATAAGVGYVGNELTGGVDVGRRTAVAKILSRTPTRSAIASTYEPRLLVSAGDETRVNPTVVKKYVALTGVYSNLTNGSIAAANLAAANDMLVVGYTDQFSSVNFQVGTANNGGKVFDEVYYWDGAEWNAFTAFSDFTTLTYDGSNSLGKTDTISRVVWWTKPTDWVAGGPAGAQLGTGNYCIAVRITGAFAALANTGVYPVLDTPIADIMLGSNVDAFDAVVTSLGAAPTYADVTAEAATIGGTFGARLGVTGAGATYGSMIVGYSSPFQAIGVVAGANQAVNTTIAASYWNGIVWSTSTAAGWTGAVTDGTSNAGTLKQSGLISWVSLPTDWQPAPMTDLTGFTATGLTTVTTDALYWVQLNTAAQLTAGTTISQLTVAAPSKTWLETAPVGSAFVDGGEQIKVTVMDSETTATVEMKVVLMDV